MINPYRGVLIEGNFYDYVSESFRESVPIRNTTTDAQSNRVLSSGLGKANEQFAITIALGNTHTVYAGTSTVGVTNWNGVSQLAYIKDTLGADGSSMPITFVNPYGATSSVVPTGTLDISLYNPSNPNDTSAEFYVSTTLDKI